MTKSKTEHLPIDGIADPVLGRLYWGFMLKDLLHKLGEDATEQNKERLHEFHKQVLGYKTISGVSQTIMSRFLFDVTCWWATEKGIFVRTKEGQPYDIENRPLREVWQWL